MRQRQGRLDFGKIVMLFVAASLLWGAYAFVPPHWAEREMHNVVILTLYTWRDRNLKLAQAALPREMDKAGIPEYIWPEDCRLWEEHGEKHLDCYWEVDVFYPFTDKLVKTLEFEVHHYIDEKGNDRDWFEE